MQEQPKRPVRRPGTENVRRTMLNSNIIQLIGNVLLSYGSSCCWKRISKDCSLVSERTDHERLHWIVNRITATRKLAKWCLRLPESDFEVVHRTCIRHQAAHALFCFRTTEMDKCRLEDDVTAILITEAKPECWKFERDANIWHGLPRSDTMHTGKPALHEVQQMSDGTVNGGLLTIHDCPNDWL